MWLSLFLFFMSSITMSYHLNEVEPNKLLLLLLNTSIIYYTLFRQLRFNQKLKNTYLAWAGLLAMNQVMMGERWSFISTIWIVSSICWQYTQKSVCIRPKCII